MFDRILEAAVPGVLEIFPKVFEDNRGYFFESFSNRDLETLGLSMPFVQDNESFSKFKVIRGLHFQLEHPQGKLIRVVDGSILDVALDLRVLSPTFGQHVTFLLSAWEPKLVYIPPGCAHGFLVTSRGARVQYKCTDFYCPNDQRGIFWDDPDLNIPWAKWVQREGIIISEQDNSWPYLAQVREELIAHAESTKKYKMSQLCGKTPV